MNEYYIQYFDRDDGWTFFVDNRQKVIVLNSYNHAKNQIEYFVKSSGNLVPQYWVDETYETRIIKMNEAYDYSE